MKYLGVVQYLGAAYSGFQRQKNAPTVQAELEEKLSSVLGVPTQIKGAGRTDAKVNAKGQTFSFSYEKEIADIPSFIFAMNRLLPKDISLISLREVPEGFDARHSNCGKIYSYSFYFGKKDPFLSLTSAYIPYLPEKFDPKAFEKALQVFLGKHDFRNFTAKEEDVDGFVREIRRIELKEEKPMHFRVLFEGNGFMTYMIRFLIGGAMKVGLGKLSVEELSALLEQRPRHIVAYNAAPEGLCLEEVLYEGI